MSILLTFPLALFLGVVTFLAQAIDPIAVVAPEIQNFLQWAIGVVLAWLAAQLMIVGKRLFLQFLDNLRSKVDPAKLQVLDYWVTELVRAAEQYGVLGLIKNEGAVKKAWVLARTDEILKRLGLDLIDEEAIAALIESKINQGLQHQPPTLTAASIETSANLLLLPDGLPDEALVRIHDILDEYAPDA